MPAVEVIKRGHLKRGRSVFVGKGKCPPAKGACIMPRRISARRVSDQVAHPAHYNRHPSGVECLTITEHFNFNIGNAVKYCWRAGLKGDAVTDLRKAEFYIAAEIKRIQRSAGGK